MTSTTVPGECKFAYPLFANESLVRALMEHGDGRFSVCTINRKVAEAFKGKPVKADYSFTMQDLVDLATMGFTGHPGTKDDPDTGRKLAAGVLMFAAALNILDMQETT